MSLIGRPPSRRRNARRDVATRLIFAQPGLGMVIAKRLGLTHQAVSAWNRVPARHVMDLLDLLNLTPEQIRPDVWTRKLRR